MRAAEVSPVFLASRHESNLTRKDSKKKSSTQSLMPRGGTQEGGKRSKVKGKRCGLMVLKLKSSGITFYLCPFTFYLFPDSPSCRGAAPLDDENIFRKEFTQRTQRSRRPQRRIFFFSLLRKSRKEFTQRTRRTDRGHRDKKKICLCDLRDLCALCVNS